MSIRPGFVASALALLVPAAQAAPYIPTSGSAVIEQLPRRAEPALRELHALRAQLAASPRDLALATRTAQRYIAAARSETDPRYFGYAQAALAPWWGLAAPPLEVRLLRATLLQSTHHFPEALRDLDAIVGADPGNPQAWLTRATVLTVRGDYAAAAASCARLSRLSTDLVGVTCMASVASMTGRSAGSETLLADTLRRDAEAGPEMQSWVLTLLAEMAGRRGDAAAAEERFRRALSLTPRDSYLVGAYCDFLLERGRAREVLRLVAGQHRIDGLLLRHALALRHLPGQGEALRAARAELGARFDATMQRGDTVHQREQARYELHLRGDSKAALALARQNWEVQKEPADMRILLEAALAARAPGSAAPVLDWARKHRLEDASLAPLIRQLAPGA